MKLEEVASSLGQCFELAVVIARKILAFDLTVKQVKELIEQKDHPFWVAFNEATKLLAPRSIVETSDIAVTGWKAFYQKFFDIDVDLSTLRIPEKVEGFTRLIVIAKGICLNQVWNVHQERNIPVWQWWNGSLENSMNKSERGQVKETYAFWVRDTQEAIDVDEKLLKELSAETIAERKIDTENLLERLIHGLKFFDETDKHLDVRGVTLCASSRFSDVDVPSVYRRNVGGVRVNRCYVTYSGPCIRARRAVR